VTNSFDGHLHDRRRSFKGHTLPAFIHLVIQVYSLYTSLSQELMIVRIRTWCTWDYYLNEIESRETGINFFTKTTYETSNKHNHNLNSDPSKSILIYCILSCYSIQPTPPALLTTTLRFKPLTTTRTTSSLYNSYTSEATTKMSN